MDTIELFGTEKISRLLFKLAPPVMLAQLIQALYNIIDSLFVGRYSASGLTALSIIYPIQLLMIALAVGTGVGINTVMSAKMGVGQAEKADEYAGIATPLALALWGAFAAVCWCILPTFAAMSTKDPVIAADVVTYGRIVCVFSIGLFLESVWTKVLQARGDMKTPMYAQIAGALTNIVLDPIFIFGLFGFPETGIAGAALATVAGQIVAALIVMKRGFQRSPALRLYAHHIRRIFRLGLPNILMQTAYTFYILGLNLILSTFSDQAVTALGLYYKWQTFFFIPLGAMQTCIVPIISFNYAARNIERCKKTLSTAIFFGLALMALGTLCYVSIPAQMLRVFTKDEVVIAIGKIGFRFVGVSFIPMVTSLIFPVFFQAVGSSLKSSALTVIRTVVLFVPLGYLFSRFGLNWFWMTFPVTETITAIVGFVFYHGFLQKAYVREPAPVRTDLVQEVALKPSAPGVIITIAREHGSSGKQIGKLVAEKLGIPFYYKEMIALAAHESGLDQEFISDIHQNAPEVLQSLYLSTRVVGHAIEAQEKIIRKIADNGSCVLVGRAADYVLRENKNVVRVFVYADKEVRVRRVMASYGDSRVQALRHIRASDKARGAYYRHISGHRWGDRTQYELCLDSTQGLEQAVDVLLAFAREYSTALPAEKP